MYSLKIEMIHDIVCSWCRIGSHNVDKALARLVPNVTTEFHYLPFELNPDLPDEGVDITEHLCTRNNWTRQQAADYRENLVQITRKIGVVIDFSKRKRYFNTHMAHRFLIAAAGVGRQVALHRQLLHAYHVQGLNISQQEVLVAKATSAGLDSKTIDAALTSDVISELLLQQQERVNQFKPRSVPAFIFNETDLVSGSNSIAFFENYIREKYLPPQQMPTANNTSLHNS